MRVSGNVGSCIFVDFAKEFFREKSYALGEKTEHTLNKKMGNLLRIFATFLQVLCEVTDKGS